MKKLIFVSLILSLLTTSVAFAQTKDEAEVGKLVEQLRKAMVDADKTKLEKLSDAGLSYGHSSGKVENKQEFIENIINGNSDFVKIDLSEQTIHISSNTAVVRHRFTAETNDKGKEPAKVNISVLTIWQKKGNDWKLLARQAVKLL